MAVDPGWYPDGSGLLRYWDGQSWTEHTHVPAPAAAQPSRSVDDLPGRAPGRPRLSGGGVAALVVAAVLALAGIGLMLVPTLTGGSPGAVAAPTWPAGPDPVATDDDEAAPDVAPTPGGSTASPAAALELAEITPDSPPADVAIAWAAAWNANDCASEHRLSASELTWGLSAEEYCDGLEATGDEPVLIAAEVISETLSDGTAEVTLVETVDWGDGWTAESTTLYTLWLTEDGWRVAGFDWVE